MAPSTDAGYISKMAKLLRLCGICLLLGGCVTTGAPVQSSAPVSHEGTVTLVLHTSIPGKADVSAGRIIAGGVAFFASAAAPQVGMAVADTGTLKSKAVGFFAGSKAGDGIMPVCR